MVKFYRGLAEKFKQSSHADGLYFATDKGVIFLNDQVYGSGNITDVTLSEEGVLTIKSWNPATKEDFELTYDLKTSIPTAVSSVDGEGGTSGLMSAADKEALDNIVKAIKDGTIGTVKDVAENDNILALDAQGILSATVSLSYDSDNKEIKLLGKNNANLGKISAAPFIKDGMLDDVKVETIEGVKYIKFTWNTDSADGTPKTDSIALSELITPYTAGDGIAISDNNEISVDEIGGEKVSINSIPVGGTPLADILTAKGINSINAGNIQAVLESLFSKEDWPANPTRSFTSPSVSQSEPTVTAGATMKIGSTFNFSATAKTASGSATVKYSGFDYGYSSANDNTRDGATPPPVEKDIVYSSGNYTMSASITQGFTGSSIPEANITQNANGASLSSTALTVAKGANKVKVITGTPKFTITIPKAEMPIYYACSTLKKTSPDHVVAAATENKVYENLQKTNVSKEITVNGVYPLYTNAVWAADPTSNATNAGNSGSVAISAWSVAGSTGTSMNEKLTTLTNGTTTFYAFVSFGAGGFTIKLPSGWKIDLAQTKSDMVQYQYDGGQVIPTATTEEITVAGTAKDTYNVYTFAIDASNVIRLKITTIS